MVDMVSDKTKYSDWKFEDDKYFLEGFYNYIKLKSLLEFQIPIPILFDSLNIDSAYDAFNHSGLIVLDNWKNPWK